MGLCSPPIDPSTAGLPGKLKHDDAFDVFRTFLKSLQCNVEQISLHVNVVMLEGVPMQREGGTGGRCSRVVAPQNRKT